MDDKNPGPWQPIETAPKDGTVILTYAVTENACPIAVSCWLRDTWRDDGRNPTHWMPLPEPPK